VRLATVSGSITQFRLTWVGLNVENVNARRVNSRHNSQSLRMLGRIEEAQKALREGIHRAEHSLMLNPLDGRALSLGSCALFADGQTARAMEWSQRSLKLYPDDMSTLANAACVHAKAGQKEEALALIERVFARGRGKRDWVEHDPSFDSLRDDPRFQKLLAKLK
jgi:adenylate cyclase